MALYMSFRVAWRFASSVFEAEADERVELTVARDSLRTGVGAVDGRSKALPVRERAGEGGRCCEEEVGESLAVPKPLRTLAAVRGLSNDLRNADASGEPKTDETSADEAEGVPAEEKRSFAVGNCCWADSTSCCAWIASSVLRMNC